MAFFKSFRVQIVLRLILIIGLGTSATYILVQTYFWMMGLWLYLFFGIAIYELVRFLERIKRHLSDFLISIRQKDFSVNYQKRPFDRHDMDLLQAFETITTEFQKLRKEKESNYHFLQTIVEHSTVPMIGFREHDESVTLMNEAAKSLFNKPFLKSVRALKQVSPPLTHLILKLKSGEKELVKVTINDEFLNLSVSAKELKLDGAMYKLVSLQNIKSELDEKELESWQKLIRVLTHEIKNSAIPISTLTEVINQLITNEEGHLKDLSTLSEEDKDDIQIGIKTVQKRSAGLVSFVNTYGELAKIPDPKPTEVNLRLLVVDITALLKNDIEKGGIQLVINVEDRRVLADISLIEQVLINLIKNAIEAIKGIPSPSITIFSGQRQGRTVLSVKDNGPGMDEELLEHIFVPFYTTKQMAPVSA